MSVSTTAATYVDTTLTGTNAETGFKKLGEGTRVLSGTGIYGKGTGYAMRIVKWLPDSAVTKISLSKGNSASSEFKAQATNSLGENQSYYIRWKGNSSKAKASLKLAD